MKDQEELLMMALMGMLKKMESMMMKRMEFHKNNRKHYRQKLLILTRIPIQLTTQLISKLLILLHFQRMKMQMQMMLMIMMELLLYLMIIQNRLTHKARLNKILSLQQTHFLWPQQLLNLSKVLPTQYIPLIIVHHLPLKILHHLPLGIVPLTIMRKIKNTIHKILIVSVSRQQL